MKVSTAIGEATEAICPSCDTDAAYRHGKIETGKQRFICVMCGTQFIPGATKSPVKGKPVCPECGRPMNIYKLEGDVIQFRCSGHPACKTFRKFAMKEEK